MIVIPCQAALEKSGQHLVLWAAGIVDVGVVAVIGNFLNSTRNCPHKTPPV